MDLKHGRWVTGAQGVGILQRERVKKLDEAGNVVADYVMWYVHMTDDNGDTKLVVPLDAFGDCRQSTLAEIPAARRPPASETMAALGYT